MRASWIQEVADRNDICTYGNRKGLRRNCTFLDRPMLMLKTSNFMQQACSTDRSPAFAKILQDPLFPLATQLQLRTSELRRISISKSQRNQSRGQIGRTCVGEYYALFSQDVLVGESGCTRDCPSHGVHAAVGSTLTRPNSPSSLAVTIRFPINPNVHHHRPINPTYKTPPIFPQLFLISFVQTF
jgi:hypothetical protein